MNGEATNGALGPQEVMPNQPTSHTELGPDVVGKTVEIAPTKVPDIGHFERLLEDVPDRFSPVLTPEQRAAYEVASVQRWNSLTILLANVIEIEPEELDKATITGFLVEFALLQPERRQSRLPDGYRAMYAVMLWKYLQGAPREEIQHAAYSANKEFIAKVSAIRTTFINFVDRQLNKRVDNGGKEPPKDNKESSTTKQRNPLMDRTAARNRLFEQEAADAYRKNRWAETRDSGAEKVGLVTQLATTLGGNSGAYSEVFDVVARVPVEETDIRDVRNRLWGAIVGNLQQWAPASAERLNNEEVKWLAMVCGKIFVVNKENKDLDLADAEPLNLSQIRALAQRHYETESYGAQPPRTANDVEYIILSACRKLIG